MQSLCFLGFSRLHVQEIWRHLRKKKERGRFGFDVLCTKLLVRRWWRDIEEQFCSNQHSETDTIAAMFFNEFVLSVLSPYSFHSFVASAIAVSTLRSFHHSLLARGRLGVSTDRFWQACSWSSVPGEPPFIARRVELGVCPGLFVQFKA